MLNDEARRAQRTNLVKSISAMSLGPNRIKSFSVRTQHSRATFNIYPRIGYLGKRNG